MVPVDAATSRHCPKLLLSSADTSHISARFTSRAHSLLSIALVCHLFHALFMPSFIILCSAPATTRFIVPVDAATSRHCPKLLLSSADTSHISACFTLRAHSLLSIALACHLFHALFMPSFIILFSAPAITCFVLCMEAATSRH